MEQVTNDNQDAPLKEDKAVEAVSKTTDTVDTAVQSNETANKTETVVPAFDAQKTYDGLRGEFDKVSRSYSELRKEFSRRTAHESELQKKIDSLAEMLSKATETPIDPEQFIRDLQTQGPKALEPHFQKWVTPIRSEYDKQLAERDAKLLNYETNFELMKRRNDAQSFPDFAKLEPLMNELANDENCPVNWNVGIPECLDTLYKLARDRSADKAIQEAVKFGEKKAEEKLVKESRTTVTGGGKSAGSAVPDLDKVTDINKLREIVGQLHGVADRD
jgi:hypothetical protein